MKTGKLLRFLPVLALLCVLFCLTAQRAEAATEYPLWVGGKQVTSDNMNDVFGDGKVKYDPSGMGTLTLTNYTFSGKGHSAAVEGKSSRTAAIWYDGSLVIEVHGVNSVAEAGKTDSVYNASCGIYVSSKLTISGDGSLTAAGGPQTELNRHSAGIFVGWTLGVRDSATVTGVGGKGEKSDSWGINAGHLYVYDETKVTGQGGTAHTSYGIVTSGDIRIEGGTLTGTGGKAQSMSCGVNATSVTVNKGSLTGTGEAIYISDSYDSYTQGSSMGIHDTYTTVTGGTVTATGGKAGSSFGLRSTYGPSFSGGKVTAKGGESTNDVSVGIRVLRESETNSFKISGADVTAEGGSAKGDSCGVLIPYYDESGLCGITLTGGSLKATGGTSASGYSYGISITNDLNVQGGTLEASGTNYGVYTGNGVSVGSGRVTATGGDTESDVSYGIYCQDGPITVSGGAVKATGGKSTGSSSCGVYTGKDSVNVIGGSLTAKGGQAYFSSSGVYTNNGNVVVSVEGSLTATGGKAGDGFDSCGVYSKRSLKVEGGTLEASGINYGVYAKSGIAVSDGCVTADGGYSPDGTTCGMYTADTYSAITVSGGTVYATGGMTDTGCTYGLWAGDADMAVTGGQVYATGGAASGGLSAGVRSGRTLRLEGEGYLNASGVNYGACAGTGAVVSGGDIYAISGYGTNDHAIHAEEGGVTVSGGSVTAVGCTGIYTESDTDGDVVVEDGSYIFISGGEYGIDSAGDIIISGGTVQAEGKYYGLTADGDLRISGGSVTSKSTSAYGYGVYTVGSVDIEFPAEKVRFESSSAAAYAESGINISEGMEITDPSGGAVDSEYKRQINVSSSDSTPAQKVTVEQGLYTLTLEKPEHGSVTYSPVQDNYHYLDQIDLNVSPEKGWKLYSLTCNGMEITGESFKMPGAGVTLRAVFKPVDYTVSVTASHGSVTAPATARYGDTVSLTVKPDIGYAPDKLTVKDPDGKTVKVTDGTFIMPASNVTVTASFKAVNYTVTIAKASHGSVSADRATAHYKDTVTLTVTPDAGYELDKLTVKDSDGNPMTVTDNKFTMPASDVKVTASFKAIPPAVSGSFSGGKLKATFTAPAGSILIAARYEGGRQDVVKLISVSELSVGKTVSADLEKKDGCTYRLILVNGGTWSPLCGAWTA